MKYITLSFFLSFITVAGIAQNDTTVARLERELNAASSREVKIEKLKELIDQTVLNNRELCDKYISQLIFLAEETRDRKLMADVRLHVARAFLSQGGVQSLLDKSKVYADEALKIAKGVDGLEKQEIIALLTLVRIHRNSGRGEKAIQVNSDAITLANDLGDDSLRVISHLALGRTYLYRDEKLTAFKNFLTALNIADQSKSKDRDWLEVNCYRSLADFFSSIEDYDKAIDYYIKITEYDKQQKNYVDLMNNTRVIGDFHRYAKRYDVATNYFERSSKMADSLKNFEGKVQGTLSILNNLFATGDFKKGIKYFDEHPEIDTFLRNLNLYYVLDKAKAGVFVELKQFDSARVYYKKVMPVLEQESNPYTKMQFYFEYGYAQKKMGNIQEAIVWFDKSKQLAQQTNNLQWLKETANMLDSCYQQTGDFKNALFYSSMEDQLKDSLTKLSKAQDLIAMEIESENKRKERRQKEEEEALQRRHNIQYSAIIVSILFLFIVLASFGFLRVPINWIKILGFFSFIFFFEFIILIADQQIHHATHGEPWKVLAIKVALIAILLPLHHLIEKKVVNLITEQRIKREARKAQVV